MRCVIKTIIVLYSAGGVDFTQTRMDLTFSSNVTRQYVTVWITDDNILEGEENFYIVVNSTDPRCVPGRRARVTIASSGKYNNF